MSGRRFPAPWSVRELEQAFVVVDAAGQSVSYTYFRKDENEARQANVLTRDEARRIAANIAKLPALLSGQGRGDCGFRALPARDAGLTPLADNVPLMGNKNGLGADPEAESFSQREHHSRLLPKRVAVAQQVHTIVLLVPGRDRQARRWPVEKSLNYSIIEPREL